MINEEQFRQEFNVFIQVLLYERETLYILAKDLEEDGYTSPLQVIFSDINKALDYTILDKMVAYKKYSKGAIKND